MSIERALIAQARPQLVSSNIEMIISEEIFKGCSDNISNIPLPLEPPYLNFNDLKRTTDTSINRKQKPTKSYRIQDLWHLKTWIEPDQGLNWRRCESFVKQLSTNKYRTRLEIKGNKESVEIVIVCHQDDVHQMMAAFQGEYQKCELTPLLDENSVQYGNRYDCNIIFKDYFPRSPYSHLLTCPGELNDSPLESFINSLTMIRPPAQGLLQIIFVPADPNHDWHRNVETLLDLEYSHKLLSGLQPWQRYSQQSPSGDLHHMSLEVNSKAHNDKPIFFLALRIAVLDAEGNAPQLLNAISVFTNLFQHGGRPLGFLTHLDYKKKIKPTQIQEMFALGLTYRNGFLVNSSELTGLVHLPPLGIMEYRDINFKGLDALSKSIVQTKNGTLIGYSSYAGGATPVRIPACLRSRHIHIIGKPGMGKSSLDEHIILADIEDGHGVAVLDPHGDLVERLLHLIPEDKIDRTIYFNPGDPDWVPIWNPLEYSPGQDIGRTADDMIRAIKGFVKAGSWGDRMENILRHIIFSLIPLPHSTLFDVATLLRNKSKACEHLVNRILQTLDNDSVRQFWKDDHPKYRNDELGPPRNKLSKLLVGGTMSLMLSQPDNLIDLRQIMDQGMIFLVDLSTIGSEQRETLGCFLLSLFHLKALSRAGTPRDNRKQFHIHLDEAHRFTTDALEDLISETRKFGVSLNLAHQYLKQFQDRKTGAITSVGTTVIFNVDEKDARFLTKDMRGRVKSEDLTKLEVAEAVARVGTEVVRFRLPPPLVANRPDIRYRIIQLSRKKYYRPLSEVQKTINRRQERWNPEFVSLHSEADMNPNGAIEEDKYDEWN